MENSLSAVATIGIYIDIDYNWDSALLYILDIKFNLSKYIENSEDLDLDGLEMQLINKTYLNTIFNKLN